VITTATAVRAARRTALLVGLAVWSGEARAQTFSVSGSPATMQVSTATAGLGFTPVTDASTTYNLHGTGNGNHEMTAQIDAAMPAGVTLTVELAAPSKSTSSGPVALGVAPLPVITNMGPQASNNGVITYVLSAIPEAGVVPVQSRTVTFTIVATP
jgi:hypothetical protein